MAQTTFVQGERRDGFDDLDFIAKALKSTPHNILTKKTISAN